MISTQHNSRFLLKAANICLAAFLASTSLHLQAMDAPRQPTVCAYWWVANLKPTRDSSVVNPRVLLWVSLNADVHGTLCHAVRRGADTRYERFHGGQHQNITLQEALKAFPSVEYSNKLLTPGQGLEATYPNMHYVSPRLSIGKALLAGGACITGCYLLYRTGLCFHHLLCYGATAVKNWSLQNRKLFTAVIGAVPIVTMLVSRLRQKLQDNYPSTSASQGSR